MKKLLLFFILILSMSSCGHQTSETTSPEKKSFVDSLVNRRLTSDSINILLSQFIADDNKYGIMRIHIENANRNHLASNYNESLEDLNKAFEAAEQIADTLEMMSILNSSGTNLRRVGAMGEASSYFYKSLTYFQEYSGNTRLTAKKSRLVALNSIGNINKTIGNNEAADSLFRVALQGSLEVDDIVGCAINSANIGLIFELNAQFDSAWYYQNKAMEYNKQANYRLGVAITHINYGKLYEMQGDYDSAMREYQASMDSTREMSNRWQWLMSSTKWIGLNILKGNYDMVRADLDLAEQYAHDIHSLTHLSDVARLNHLFYEGKGDYRKALNYFRAHKHYSDSLRSTQSSDEAHNLRLQYERENSNREILVMQKEHEMKQRDKDAWIKAVIITLLLAITAIVFLIYALQMRTRSQKVIKQIDEMRSSFFTNITHEFRTPLTVIIGMANQLKKKVGNETESQIIIRQSEALLFMVNQLLDMAKIKSCTNTSKWCHDDVVAYINMTAETYREYLTIKGIDLIFMSDKRSIFMDFVPEYFDKILRNLLSNAKKHTPKDGVITISITSGSANMTLTVSDTGKGIHPDDLPHIFEEFYQGDQSHSEAGAGIGLAFVSKMIENMGGRISAANLPEGGAEFCFTMPLKQRFEVKDTITETTKIPYQNEQSLPHPYEQDESIMQQQTASLTDNNEAIENDKPSILIVEDNVDVRFYIGSLFEDKYDVHFASNGHDGITKAKDIMPDLIVTDLMMPVMDGFAVCHAIRASEILNHIPIIIITAKATDEDKQRAIEEGADAYLHKPFNVDELNIRVSKLLEQRRMLRDKYSKAMIEGLQESIELSTADRQFLNRTTSVIFEQITDPDLNPEKVSNKMYMSRSQLNRKVRNITGNSTAAYILHVRIEKAKRMLLTDETPVGEIAIKCGFEDSSYFSRVFKQIYNDTPTQFRKKSH